MEIRTLLNKWTFFDGVDIDWEKPENVEEANQYISFMQELKGELRNGEIESIIV
jgi:GH18 family chitinase